MQNQKIFLDVSFKEKEKAKHFGAKWDAQQNVWFAEQQSAKKGIEEFIPHIIIKGPLYVLKTEKICWSCNNLIEVIGFTADDYQEQSSLSEMLHEDENDEEIQNTLKNYINEVELEQTDVNYNKIYIIFSNLNFYKNQELYKIITKKFPFYKTGFSKAGGKYIANHCSCCGKIQGDHFIFHDFGGEFYPESIEEFNSYEKEELLNKPNIPITSLDFTMFGF